MAGLILWHRVNQKILCCLFQFLLRFHEYKIFILLLYILHPVSVFSRPLRPASALTCHCLINGAILANLLRIPGGAPEAVCDKILAHAQFAASQLPLHVRWQIDRTVDDGAPFTTAPATTLVFSDISTSSASIIHPPLWYFQLISLLFLSPITSPARTSTDLYIRKKADAESRTLFGESYATLPVDFPSTPHFSIAKN